MPDGKKVHVLKVLIAGEGNSGKTSLVHRFCFGKFDDYRAHTIGLEFNTVTIKLKSGGVVKLAIWDLAGQPQFYYLRKEFYSGSRATALVFDLTSQDSFLQLRVWHDEILQACPFQNFLLVGNKTDLKRSRKVSEEIAQRFADSIGAPYLETSAKKGRQVRRMFQYLVRLAIEGYGYG
jgi:small GTP-binding protein